MVMNKKTGSSDFCVINLSHRPRFGVRGRGVSAALSDRRVPLPNHVNTWLRLSSGGITLRTGNHEYWWLSDAEQSGGDSTAWRNLSEPDCYPLFCRDSHCWWRCSGAASLDVFGQLFTIDPQRAGLFANGFAQTQVAHINAIVVPAEGGLAMGFDILCDSSYEEYIGGVLNEMAAER